MYVYFGAQVLFQMHTLLFSPARLLLYVCVFLCSGVLSNAYSPVLPCSGAPFLCVCFCAQVFFQVYVYAPLVTHIGARRAVLVGAVTALPYVGLT